MHKSPQQPNNTKHNNNGNANKNKSSHKKNNNNNNANNPNFAQGGNINKQNQQQQQQNDLFAAFQSGNFSPAQAQKFLERTMQMTNDKNNAAANNDPQMAMFNEMMSNPAAFQYYTQQMQAQGGRIAQPPRVEDFFCEFLNFYFCNNCLVIFW